MICPNCGNKCKDTFCSEQCFDEAIQYDEHEKLYGKAVADAWWEERRLIKNDTKKHQSNS